MIHRQAGGRYRQWGLAPVVWLWKEEKEEKKRKKNESWKGEIGKNGDGRLIGHLEKIWAILLAESLSIRKISLQR